MSPENKDFITINPDAEIIAVDDEPSITGVWDMILSSEGYKIQIMNNPLLVLEAVNRLREIEHTPVNRVFLLDLYMPGLDGMALGKEILGLYPGARLIMCTAASKDAEFLSFIRSKNCDYLPKPFEVDDLLTMVQKNKELL